MVSFPGIVLVDDNKEDLDTLQNSFTCAGYPCFPIHYKNDEPDNESGIDHVNLGLIKPRVIFTDLNLQEQQVDAAKLVGPVAEVLKKLSINGPYILYFWSKNVGTVSKVMTLIEQRYSNDIFYPLKWGILDKAEFKANPSSLKNKVEHIFEETPMFNALLGWENRVSTAAQNTTDSLYRLATSRKGSIGLEEFQSEVTNNLQTMLAVIGNEAIGQKNALDTPEVAIELGLEPVLYDHIQSAYESIDRSVWLDAAPEVGTRLSVDVDVKAHLNSFYHIENLSDESSKGKRGTWVQLEKNYFDSSDNESKIRQNFGRNIKTLLNEEFLDSSQGSSKNRKEVHEATNLGFLELSAECDQAQRKTKLNRYFLSAMIPVEYERYTFFRNGKNNSAHAGIYRLPNLIIDGKEYIVKISFMYQIGGIPDFNKWLGKPLFRLKDQILSDISFKASQHTTRPGIIRFD